MIDVSKRRAILKHGKPDPSWQAEPLLGSVYDEQEIAAAVAAIREAMAPNVGFGFSSPPIPDFEQAFAKYVGTRHAVAINSAGPGLDMLMRFMNLQDGDEVIVPAINYVAAPLAVIGAGGQLVWAEVNPNTLQLDPHDVEKRITSRTRAILVTHMNGLSSPMDDLIDLAVCHPHPKHGPIAIVGDAARACGGEYRNTKIGKKGLATVFSFQSMKNMTTLGEGGMITTDDDDVERYCRATRMYGQSAEVWGTSNVMTKVQAAVGLVQLNKLDGFIADRRRVAQHRHELLADVSQITLPFEPSGCLHTYYLYTCLVCEAWAGRNRDQIVAWMNDEFGAGCGVISRPAYLDHALLLQHAQGSSLSGAEIIGQRLLCVSLHPSMTEQDNEYIAASFIECVERLR